MLQVLILIKWWINASLWSSELSLHNLRSPSDMLLLVLHEQFDNCFFSSVTFVCSLILSLQFYYLFFTPLLGCTFRMVWMALKIDVFFILLYHNLMFWFRVLLTFLQSEVFAVAFALLAAGAVILTLNVLLLVCILALLTFANIACICMHLRHCSSCFCPFMFFSLGISSSTVLTLSEIGILFIELRNSEVFSSKSCNFSCSYFRAVT